MCPFSFLRLSTPIESLQQSGHISTETNFWIKGNVCWPRMNHKKKFAAGTKYVEKKNKSNLFLRKRLYIGLI